MDYMDELTRDGVSRLTGQRPQLAGPSRVPALQAPLYTPEQPPRIAGPSGNLPAQQVPWYTPEQPPRLAAPAEAPASSGPLSRAAGRIAPLAGAAGLLAGGAAATEAATGTVAANPDYFKTSIGDDGLAANILTAARDSQPQTIADVARSQPNTARTQNGPTSIPMIAQMAAGDSTAGAGRGSVNPPNVQPSPIAALANTPRYDDTYRADNLRNNQNQAFREGDPIGQIIAQRMGQQDGAQEPAPRYLAAQAGGIIGGGDTTYSPGMAARTEAFQTADGRRIDPSDANLSAADSGLIGQYKAQNAQALADIERQQRTNPLAGAVQIIRPGNDVSYAVQGADRMIEIGGDDFDAYQSALARNPQMGSQMQMTEGGMRIGGLLAPPELADAGPEALQKFAQAKQQSIQNAADPLAAETAAKIEVEKAKGQSALAVEKAKSSAGEADQAATAPILGVPVPTVTPWSNQTNSRDANKVKAAEIARGAKEVEKDSDSARTMESAATDAKRFLELNKKVGTGSVLDKFGPTRAAQRLGSDYAEMEALTSKLAPAMRQPGSGATSDFDAKQFERATVSVDKPQATNENIGNAAIARAKQAKDYADFRQTYLEQNRTLQGSDRYWKDYADKNPIFDPKKEGTFDLNPARKDWREHFSPKSGGPSSAQGPAPAVQPTRKTVGDRTFENDGKGWYEVK
jgi:hypothetical protein